MTTCTWLDKKDGKCTAEATTPQINNDGAEWANLCPKHAVELEHAIEHIADEPMLILGCWLAAEGGPAVAAQRMTAAIQAGSTLAAALYTYAKDTPGAQTP